MRLQSLKLVLIILCLNLFNSGFAQREYRVNQYLSIDNDLSNNAINAIFEDSRGVVWVGTSLGLNKYDGYQIVVYKNRLGQMQLCSDRIYCINEDGLGRLWLGTDLGVEIFDVDKQQFLNIQNRSTTNISIESTHIVDIKPSSDGSMMICATQNQGLLVYDAATTQLIRNDNDRWIDIVEFKALDDNRYLVATKERLSIYDVSTGKSFDIEGVTTDKSDIIRDVATTPTSIYVVLNKGIRKIDYNSGGFEPNETIYYPKHKFGQIFIESHGKVLISDLLAGLYMLPSLDKMGEEYEIVAKALIVTTINELASSNYIWIGSRYSGVFRLDNNAPIFNTLSMSDAPSFRLSYLNRYDDNTLIAKGTQTGSFLYDVRSNSVKKNPLIDALPPLAMPFVHHDGKLYALDCSAKSSRLLVSTKGEWREIKHKGAERLPELTTTSVWVDDRGDVWFCSRERLSRLQAQDRLSRLQLLNEAGQSYYTLQNIELPVASTQLQRIRSLAFDGANSRVWIGTAHQGLYRIDNIDSSRIKQSQITHLYDDGDYITGEQLDAIPTNFIADIAIFEDELYIGNFMGLFRGVVDGYKCTFKVYSKESGLPSDVIKAITTDGDRGLLIYSVRGISTFDPHSEKFCNYGIEDGLPFHSLSDYVVRLNDNSVVLSTLSKAVEFNPQSLNHSKSIPNIELGELKLFNQKMYPGDVIDGKVVIKRRLMDGDTVQLNYNSNMISIGMHLMHYGNPQRYSVRYRFGEDLNRDGEWVYRTSNNMTLSFSDLKHGTYGLEIAGSNSNGDWGDSKRITIIIDAPFWLTWWAWVIYVVIALLLAYAIMRFILHLQSLQHIIEIKNISKHEQKQKQIYLSNITHEIKTPLSIVVSVADTLYENYNHDSEISKQLRLVQRQSRKISTMVETVQNIYLNKFGFLRPKLSTFEFGTFAKVIVKDFNYLAKSQQKSLSTLCTDDRIFVKADASMLERVMHNLLMNAHKYTHKGGMIELSWSVESEQLIIKVKDDGIGIAPEEIDHIFERYYRSDAVRNENIVKGTGIGLDFSRQLVELHGGEIGVESILSDGSCFTVRLPIVVDAAAEDRESETELGIIVDEIDQLTSENEVSSEFKESLIFVVEDNEDLRKMMLGFVGRYYNVKGFSDGAEALEAMDELCPDLILSDVDMPNMDGYEFCQRVKSGIATCHIPIILITACTSVEEKIRCREVGANIYISKPFYPKYVIACVETSLSNHKILREKFKIGTPVEATTQIESEKSNEFLDQLYGFLDENLSNEDIDLKMIARKMYLNRTYFYQKVKAVTNMTPYEFIKEYRLVKAAEMLLRGDKSISDICVDIGFKNRTHFSRIFKERFGVTPSRYSKASEDGDI